MVIQQPLGRCQHLGRQDRAATTGPPTHREERRRPPFTVPTKGARYAAFRDAERPDDLRLTAGPRVNQLRGHQLKASTLPRRMSAHRKNTDEVRPRVAVTMNAHQVADLTCTFGNQG